MSADNQSGNRCTLPSQISVQLHQFEEPQQHQLKSQPAIPTLCLRVHRLLRPSNDYWPTGVSKAIGPPRLESRQVGSTPFYTEIPLSPPPLYPPRSQKRGVYPPAFRSEVGFFPTPFPPKSTTSLSPRGGYPPSGPDLLCFFGTLCGTNATPTLPARGYPPCVFDSAPPGRGVPPLSLRSPPILRGPLLEAHSALDLPPPPGPGAATKNPSLAGLRRRGNHQAQKSRPISLRRRPGPSPVRGPRRSPGRHRRGCRRG